METPPPCTVNIEWPPFVPKQQCGQPAVVRLIAGCRHEHIKERDVCFACSMALADGLTVCNECDEAGDQRHDCPLDYRVLQTYEAAQATA